MSLILDVHEIEMKGTAQHIFVHICDLSWRFICLVKLRLQKEKPQHDHRD